MLKYRQLIFNYGPGNSYASDIEVATEPENRSESDQNMRTPHTGIYAIKSHFFSVFISDKI